MTNPDELERAAGNLAGLARDLERYDPWGGTRSRSDAADLRLILAANRKMREGLERIKREDIHHEGDDIDNYDSASGHQSRAWLGPFGTIARSALSTKETT